MTSNERKAVVSLASIFSLRMFGLFMLLPVLAIYAQQLHGTSPGLMGLALGAYGLTQAIFQIPFGILSDRINRKTAITLGLIIFAIGSILCALADSIYGLIIGRAVQGAGAISAAVLALNADLTRNEQRTKSMAIIGISIGFTFLLSLILAPILQAVIGVSGLFYSIVGLTILAIIVLYKVVPDEPQRPAMQQSEPALQRVIAALKTPALMQLNLAIFVSHLVLTALFLVLPGLIISSSGMQLSSHWKIYAPVLIVSVVGMAPFIRAGSKAAKVGLAYRAAVILLLVSLLGFIFALNQSFTWLVVALVVFFSAFNALESLLPSLVSQIASGTSKGTAIGVYNSFQFAGIFVGGVAGGVVFGSFHNLGVFLLCTGLTLIWMLFAIMSKQITPTQSK